MQIILSCKNCKHLAMNKLKNRERTKKIERKIQILRNIPKR